MEKLDSPAQISVEPVAAPVVPKVEGGKRRRLSHGGRHLTRSYGRRDGPFPPFAA